MRRSRPSLIVVAVGKVAIFEKDDRHSRVQNRGGPHYLRTFYLRIRLFTKETWSKKTIFLLNMDFLSANSRFAVQNGGTYQGKPVQCLLRGRNIMRRSSGAARNWSWGVQIYNFTLKYLFLLHLGINSLKIQLYLVLSGSGLWGANAPLPPPPWLRYGKGQETIDKKKIKVL